VFRCRSVLVSDLDGLSPYPYVVFVAVHEEVMSLCVECAWICHRVVD